MPQARAQIKGNLFFMSYNRITKREYMELNRLYQRIEPPAQSTLYNSGDHYRLYQFLCNLGFRPPREAIDVYRMAEEILVNGYE
jgi:hypothetical protein